MTLRTTHLGLAAVALAIAAFPLSGSQAGAFTFETVGPNGNGGQQFADPDDQVKNFGSGGTQPFGPGGPTVHFGAQQGPLFGGPFGRFQGSSPNDIPPDPYGPRSLGNND